MNRNLTIKKNHIFTRVLKKGKSIPAYTVAVYALKNYNKREPTVIGVSAGAKLGGAVSRNRAKRIIREAVRRIYPMLQGGYFIIIVARKPCFDKSTRMNRVYSDLRGIVSRMNLLSVSGGAGGVRSPDEKA